jgi:CHRD domain/PEP-CTERM motif
MKKTAPALLAAALALGATAASAHIQIFQGSFAAEAQGATGTGTLRLEYDEDGHTLLINATWAGLSGNTSNAHIHCCTAAPNSGTAGVALAQGGMLPDFPLGATSGSYIKVIDLKQTGQYGGAFLTGSGGTAAGAEERLINNLKSGNAYFNIHSTTFLSGEIRSFVTAVPEPESYALMLGGLGVLALVARRRRR